MDQSIFRSNRIWYLLRDHSFLRPYHVSGCDLQGVLEVLLGGDGAGLGPLHGLQVEGEHARLGVGGGGVGWGGVG